MCTLPTLSDWTTNPIGAFGQELAWLFCQAFSPWVTVWAWCMNTVLTLVTWVDNTFTGIIQSIFTVSTQLTLGLGIFSPIAAAAIVGLLGTVLLFAAFMGIRALIYGVGALVKLL